MEVRLPDLGEDAGDSAKVTFWYFKEGDRVDKKQNLVEMMTDKTTFDLESPATGVLKEIRVREDEEANVGDVLAVMETD